MTINIFSKFLIFFSTLIRVYKIKICNIFILTNQHTHSIIFYFFDDTLIPPSIPINLIDTTHLFGYRKKFIGEEGGEMGVDLWVGGGSLLNLLLKFSISTISTN